jgi:NADH:ubiquinone oxidoreductase subunit K
LTLLGFQTVDPVASRLVAAALFGIGIESLLVRRAPLDRFVSMLSLKIIVAFNGLWV